jgi:hypothetical protein
MEIQDVIYGKRKWNGWMLIDDFIGSYDEKNEYVIIKAKDAHIAEAVAKDSSVEVEASIAVVGDLINNDQPIEYIFDNFFESYDESYEYRLKQPTKDLSGYRVEATRDNSKEVRKLINDRKDVIVKTGYYTLSLEYFAIPNADLDKMQYDFSNIDFKQAYLHNHELVFEEPKEGGCEWKHVGGRGTNNFNTTCKREYAHKDSDYEFCPYCGKPLVATAEKE